MAETLFYRVQGTIVDWLIFNNLGQLLSQGQSPSADFEITGPAVRVVTGQDVLATSAIVPSRQYRQILQAVPFVIEESLAMDVEDCFFALGEREDSGEVSVAVVDNRLMEIWCSSIDEHGHDVRALVAEHSLVQNEVDATIVSDGERLHINGRGLGSATVRIDEAGIVLSDLSEDSIIDVWLQEEGNPALNLVLEELEAAGVEVRRSSSTESPFEHLCRAYDGSSINLLQGAYKRVEKKTSNSNLWQSVAILTACAVLVHLAMLVGQGWYLQQQASGFHVQTMAIYEQAFPNDRNVRDIKRRWDSHLGKKDSSTNVFIPLFAQSTRELSAGGLTLSSVNFNESRGDLVLQVIGNRSEDLVQYAQLLTSKGLDAEIGTITQEDGGVRGSVRIKGAS